MVETDPDQVNDANEDKSAKPHVWTAPGIVTLKREIMLPDGRTGRFLWAATWQVVTDNELGASSWSGPGTRPAESWHLVAVGGDGTVLALVPSSAFDAIVYADVAPKDHRILILERP